jgi:hypothetical protein
MAELSRGLEPLWYDPERKKRIEEEVLKAAMGEYQGKTPWFAMPAGRTFSSSREDPRTEKSLATKAMEAVDALSGKYRENVASNVGGTYKRPPKSDEDKTEKAVGKVVMATLATATPEAGMDVVNTLAAAQNTSASAPAQTPAAPAPVPAATPANAPVAPGRPAARKGPLPAETPVAPVTPTRATQPASTDRIVWGADGRPMQIDSEGNPVVPSNASRQTITIDGRVYNAETGAPRLDPGSPTVSAFGRTITRIPMEKAGGYDLAGQRVGTGNVSMMTVSPDSPMGQRLAAEELERRTREMLMRGQMERIEREIEDPYGRERVAGQHAVAAEAARRQGAIDAEKAKQEAMAAREISVLEFMFKSAAADIERRAQAEIAAIQNDPRPIPQDERARAIDNVRRRAERELEDRKASIMSRGRIGPEDIATARSMNATAGQ